MSTKRAVDSTHLSSSNKKIKLDLSPFNIDDLIRLIAFYLEGNHLLHFKLVCKRIYVPLKDWKCFIQITPVNFDRTIMTPGIHIITYKDEYIEELQALVEYRFLCGRMDDHLIKNLIFDCCGSGVTSTSDDAAFFSLFKGLQSLRIIRSLNGVILTIESYDRSLSLIEVYTEGIIDILFCRQVEKVKLCSRATLEDDRHSILIGLKPYVPKEYVQEIECFGEKIGLVIEHETTSINTATFVPSQKFLM